MTYLASSRAVKSKSKISAVATIILVLILSLTASLLISCKDDKKDVTIKVNNAEDLKAIASYIGTEEYGQITVELNADIDLGGENWASIGDSYDNSFTGVFNGNGHKITNMSFLGAEQKDNAESIADGSVTVSDYNPAESKYAGLFGFIKDAEINDLEISYSAKMRMGKEPIVDESGNEVTENIDFDTLYMGAVAGYAYGECSFQNLKISADIDLVTSVFTKKNRKGNLVTSNKYDAFIGGLAGYAMGKTKASGITSDVKILLENNEILVSEYPEYNLGGNVESRFKNVQFGGIFGYVRSVNISGGYVNENLIEKSSAKINADINGENVFCGGVVGSIYNGTVDDISVVDGTSIVVNTAIRNELGGVAGLADNSLLKGIRVSDAELEGSMVSGGKQAELITASIGGVVGYAINSTIENAYVNASISSRDGCVDYAGGIAGVLNNGTIKNTASTGCFKEDINDNLVPMDKYKELKAKAYADFDFKFGGIVGRAHAKAVISDSATSFISPKAVVGTVTQKIVYKKLTKENDDGEEEDYFEKDEENSLPRLIEDELTKELILDNYVDDATVFYDATKTLDEDTSIGTYEEGDAEFIAKRNEILNAE